MAVKTFFRNLDKKRRRLTHRLEPAIARRLNNRSKFVEHLLPNEKVKRIVIVRNNGRIGNMYFLLPFVHQVLRLYPKARVDLVLSFPWQGEVFQNLNINQIYYSHLSLKTIGQSSASIKELTKNSYDLLLAPSPGACDIFVSALIPSQNKVSFKNNKTETVFEHSSVTQSDFYHGAYKPLSILQGLGHELPKQLDHEILFTTEELVDGIKQAHRLSQDNKLSFAFFRGARGKKQLTDEEWKAILREFERQHDQETHWVEVLSPDVRAPLFPDTDILDCKSLRALGATLRYLDGFLCCDTGPLHLADAAGATCYGFYTETCPQRFGLMGRDCYPIKLHVEPSKVQFEPVARMA
ncbi:glycosyltransferase family 9 protein [Vibrio rotiferianus]|uniref:glycosyltransferase family 9 protein n=1 Tax=Vibrio rotiferianus TaxID=190895 RepID=UPI002895F611|nr:Glycosyltransferase 9 family protein [Vibrio rotiferianus]CAH1588041.1 Glycosyltransferase 9 family protein [Vibrio rotiferianus]